MRYLPFRAHICAAVIALTIPFSRADAELKNEVNNASLEYTGELGYFQKANRDLGDPIFMLYDEKVGLDFGIGGSVRVKTWLDCFGSVRGNSFNPALIDVPTDYSDRLNATIGGSELHVKARYHFGDHKVIAFIKFGGGDSNAVSVAEAYLSLDGFSFGLIPSFFMDLEVGYLTAGSSVTSPVNYAHPLFGYKKPLGKHWVIGAALEKPDLVLPAWLGTSYGLAPDNQGFPDLTLHGKYRWKGGHVQLGAVMRNIKYWSYVPPVLYAAQGITCHELGYGVSFSGSQRLSSQVKLSGEFVWGKGISRYLGLFNNTISDLGVIGTSTEDGLYRMKSNPVFHGIVGAQVDWNKKYTSTFLFSYAKSFGSEDILIPNYENNDFTNTFDHSFFADANFFWHISSNAYTGIEAMFGHTDLRDVAALPTSHGTLARVMVAFTFMF